MIYVIGAVLYIGAGVLTAWLADEFPLDDDYDDAGLSMIFFWPVFWALFLIVVVVCVLVDGTKNMLKFARSLRRD